MIIKKIQGKEKMFFFLFVFFIYLFFSGGFKWQFYTTTTNYFNYLADALIKGKLYLVNVPHNLADLIFYHGRLYLYWPVVPALVISPLVAIFGLDFSDVFYTAVAGSLNCLLLYQIIEELRTHKFLKINQKTHFLLGFFFAFGTIHFYLSLFGRVWFTHQIFGLLFFLLAVWQIIKFLYTSKLSNFILSSLFFALSVYSRNTLFFSLPFFMSVFYFKRTTWWTYFKKIFFFLLFFFLFTFLNFFYNYYRFGSILNNGYVYHLKNQFFAENFKKYGSFNLHYLPTNFFYNFLKPLTFKLEFPFIEADPMGNGLIWTSPLFFYLFKLNKKIFNSKHKQSINGGMLISLPLLISPAMFLFGTGWIQFGSRYLLEIIPFLTILLAQTINNFKNKSSLILLGISIFINLMGYFWWQNLRLDIGEK